jgi:hypothetical protein
MTVHYLVASEGQRALESDENLPHKIPAGLIHALNPETDQLVCRHPRSQVVRFDLLWDAYDGEKCVECHEAIVKP